MTDRPALVVIREALETAFRYASSHFLDCGILRTMADHALARLDELEKALAEGAVARDVAESRIGVLEQRAREREPIDRAAQYLHDVATVAFRHVHDSVAREELRGALEAYERAKEGKEPTHG